MVDSYIRKKYNTLCEAELKNLLQNQNDPPRLVYPHSGLCVAPYHFISNLICKMKMEKEIKDLQLAVLYLAAAVQHGDWENVSDDVREMLGYVLTVTKK